MADVQYVTLYIDGITPVQTVVGSPLYYMYLNLGATLVQTHTSIGVPVPGLDPADPFPQYTTPAEAAAAALIPTDASVASLIPGDGLTATALREAFVRLLPLDKSGTVDCGPLVQALYDAGAQSITLDPRGVYLFDTPVFLDRTDRFEKFVIHGNGAELRLGSNLPSTPAFTADPTTKWAFFPNTLRTALSSGVVTCDTTTRASGSVGATVRLVVNNVMVNGQGQNRALAFCNRTNAHMTGVIMQAARALLSWYDYSDGPVLDRCHARINTVPDAAMIYQVSNGDGVVVISPKCDSGIAAANLTACNGAHISGAIAKIKLNRCRAIVISGGHFESDLAASALIEMTSSQVTVDTSVLYPPRSQNVGTIVINDNEPDSFSDLTLRDVSDFRLHRTTGTADFTAGPVVYLAAVHKSTRVISERMAANVSSPGIGGIWAPSVGGRIASADTSVQAAIDNITAKSHFARGTWELSRSTGANAGWSVVNPGARHLRSVRALAAPLLSQVLPSMDDVTGALVSGQVYEYSCALRDSDGSYTTSATPISITADAAGSARLLIDAPSAPAALVIWRKTGIGVAASADAYIEVPITHYNARLYDTGANISGTPWITTGVTSPNASADINRTKNALEQSGVMTWPPQRREITTDLDITSTALGPVGLSTIAVTPSGVYELDGMLFYQADPAVGLVIGLVYPNLTTATWMAVAANGTASDTLAETGSTPLPGAGATTTRMATITGRVVISRVGNFQLRAAVGAAGTAKLLAGSFLRLRRVSVSGFGANVT